MKKQHLIFKKDNRNFGRFGPGKGSYHFLCGRMAFLIPNWKRWPLCKNCKKVARSRI